MGGGGVGSLTAFFQSKEDSTKPSKKAGVPRPHSLGLRAGSSQGQGEPECEDVARPRPAPAAPKLHISKAVFWKGPGINLLILARGWLVTLRTQLPLSFGLTGYKRSFVCRGAASPGCDHQTEFNGLISCNVCSETHAKLLHLQC